MVQEELRDLHDVWTERFRNGRLGEILFQKPPRHARSGAERGGGIEHAATINLKQLESLHDHVRVDRLSQVR